MKKMIEPPKLTLPKEALDKPGRKLSLEEFYARNAAKAIAEACVKPTFKRNGLGKPTLEGFDFDNAQAETLIQGAIMYARPRFLERFVMFAYKLAARKHKKELAKLERKA
jgi:hypothetical protein